MSHFKLTTSIQADARVVEGREEGDEEEEKEGRALRLESSSQYTTITKTNTLSGCPIKSDETRRRREIKIDRKRRRSKRDKIDKSLSRTNNISNNDISVTDRQHQICRQCLNDTSKSRMIRNQSRKSLTVKMFLSFVAIQSFLVITIITLVTASKLTTTTTLSSETPELTPYTTSTLSALANVRNLRSLNSDDRHPRNYLHFSIEQENEGKYSNREKHVEKLFLFLLYLAHLVSFLSHIGQILSKFKPFSVYHLFSWILTRN